MFFYIVLLFVAFLIFIYLYTKYKNTKTYQKNQKTTSLQHTRQKNSTAASDTFSPQLNYPPFDYARLLALGLSQEEAREFVNELILQIETQIPLIKTAIQTADFHQAERLTHSLKGSASSIGEGGVSALLIDYNTYLKHGEDISVINTYFIHLNYYLDALKKQYL
ncbi:MAG: Hpt domain-containing protein [Sulfurovum sp.]|nr:Hpt domain-containing protein [Sulfurovum sp.]